MIRKTLAIIIFIIGVVIADNVFMYLNTRLNAPPAERLCMNEDMTISPCNKGEARPE